MVNYMSEINGDIDHLIELIKTNEIYINYIKLEELLSNSDDINILIDEIKKLQKEAVNAEYKQDYEKLNEKEKTLKIKYNELNNVPLYNDYIESKEELNNLLMIIKNKFDSLVDKLVL